MTVFSLHGAMAHGYQHSARSLEVPDIEICRLPKDTRIYPSDPSPWHAAMPSFSCRGSKSPGPPPTPPFLLCDAGDRALFRTRSHFIVKEVARAAENERALHRARERQSEGARATHYCSRRQVRRPLPRRAARRSYVHKYGIRITRLNVAPSVAPE